MVSFYGVVYRLRITKKLSPGGAGTRHEHVTLLGWKWKEVGSLQNGPILFCGCDILADLEHRDTGSCPLDLFSPELLSSPCS